MPATTKVEKVLEKLVSFKTVSGKHKKAQDLLEWVQEELKSSNLHIETHEANGFVSLIATSQASKYNPKLWLMGHIDVVPASDHMFSVKYEKDKLTGRGVFDDKLAAASFIAAIKELGDVSKYDFGIILTSDEELGSENGAKHLFETLPIKGEVAFVPDSGENWTIQTKAKGAFHFKITANGKSAHGSMTWSGDNAIDKIYAAIQQMREDLNIPEPQKAKQEFLKTLNVGSLHGGEAANQVPDHAEALVDIRFPSPHDAKEIEDYFAKINSQSNGIKITDINIASPVDVSPDNSWVKNYQQILKSFKLNSSFSSSTGATDARFFAEANIPSIVSMPAGGNLHSEGEWVDRQGLNLLPQVVAELIKNTA